jgi:hypothetical protein
MPGSEACVAKSDGCGDVNIGTGAEEAIRLADRDGRVGGDGTAPPSGPKDMNAEVVAASKKKKHFLMGLPHSRRR